MDRHLYVAACHDSQWQQPRSTIDGEGRREERSEGGAVVRDVDIWLFLYMFLGTH